MLVAELWPTRGEAGRVVPDLRWTPDAPAIHVPPTRHICHGVDILRDAADSVDGWRSFPTPAAFRFATAR